MRELRAKKNVQSQVLLTYIHCCLDELHSLEPMPAKFLNKYAHICVSVCVCACGVHILVHFQSISPRYMKVYHHKAIHVSMPMLL